MSHFSVMVITDNPDELQDTLQPYHEYESTGIEDEYVVFVDCDDEIRARWAKDTMDVNSKEIPVSEHYDSIEVYAADYYGYTEVRNGKIGRLTNPNAKWDWWVIGGRWSNFLLTKSGEKVDAARMNEIDFVTMATKARQDAAADYDKKHDTIKGRTITTCEKFLQQVKDEKLTINQARKQYNGQAVLKELRQIFDQWQSFDKYFALSRDQFIDCAGKQAIRTFAVIKDGQWHEKNKMGWWAVELGDKTEEQWNDEFVAFLNSIDGNKWVTIVDCHI